MKAVQLNRLSEVQRKAIESIISTPYDDSKAYVDALDALHLAFYRPQDQTRMQIEDRERYAWRAMRTALQAGWPHHASWDDFAGQG